MAKEHGTDWKGVELMTALENKGNVQEELLQSLKVRIEKVKGGKK